MIYFLKVCICLLLVTCILPAQAIENIGHRFLKNFSYRDYNAYSENWDVVQDFRGIIYAANGKGILEYDGVTWRLLESEESVYALAIDKNGIIYYGMFGDFGHLVADTLSGENRFMSLLNDTTDYSNFLGRKIQITEDGVYCFSRNLLLCWSENHIQQWRPKDRFTSMFTIRGQLYVNDLATGLMVMKNNTLVPVPGGDFFAGDEIAIMLAGGSQTQGSEILIGSRSRGLFLYNKGKITRFSTEAEFYLQENELSCGLTLSNNHFALGTDQGGVLIINKDGKLQEILNEQTGLRNDEIKSMYTDRQGALWLALHNGIARVETPSAWSYFAEAAGIQSDISFIRRYKDRLYLIGQQGRYRGIYYLKTNAITNTVFQEAKLPGFIPLGLKTNAWALLSTEDVLMAATDDGVYLMDGNKTTRLQSDWVYTQSLCRSLQDSNRVYVGLSNGLAIIERLNGRWTDWGKVAETNSEVANIVEAADGTLWLETWAGDIWRLQDNARRDFLDKTTIHADVFSVDHDLPSEFAYVSSVQGRAVFPTASGLRYYDSDKNKFFPDASFGEHYAEDHHQVQHVVEDANGKIWIYSVHKEQVHLALAASEKDGAYTLTETPFRPLSFLGDIVYTIYPESNGIVWFGTSEGLFRYDPSVPTLQSHDYSALIRSVRGLKGDSLVYSGEQHSEKPNVSPILFDYRNNSIRFEFAAPFFDTQNGNRYQFMLEGEDEKWSEWTREAQKDYTNITEGYYTFRVRAKNIYDQLSSSGAFSFQVLPPWYRSWWAYLLYFLAFVIATLGVSKIRNRQLAERSRLLEGKVEERTREIRKQAEEIKEQAIELQEKNEEIIRTQEKLVVQEKLASLGSLTAGIAHEIKNPLNFVNNFAGVSVELIDELKEELEQIKSGIPDANTIALINELMTDIQENAQRINEHGKRADRVIQEMLKHSQGITGKTEQVDVNSLLDEYVALTCHDFKTQHPGIEINLEKTYDKNLGNIEAIPQDLSRAFVNIVNNGCYAVAEKQRRQIAGYQPTLHISTKRLDNNAIEIRFRDNGDGISEVVREKIFNPFFTTKPTGDGTGLGLSLTYDIIAKMHNGEIKLDTIAGEYTEFILVLPR